MKILIKNIHNRIETVSEYFSAFSEEELRQKAAPEKWSKKEILGHLIDSAQNNIRRFVIGQYQHEAHIVYQQNAWVKAADYQQYDSLDLLDFWILLNKHLCVILKNLPKEHYQVLTNWGGSIASAKIGEDLVPLEFVAHDYLRHLDHHLRQMGMNL